MSDQNPYASPVSVSPERDSPPIDLDLKDRQKIETIIQDAQGFWIANIFLVFLCGFGALLVPICYIPRLLQWNSLAKKYPALLSDHTPAISIQAKFKAAHWKLVTGILLGLGLFALAFLIVFLSPLYYHR